MDLIQANFVMDLNTPFRANQYAKLAKSVTEYAQWEQVLSLGG
jgi:hypothetical protein